MAGNKPLKTNKHRKLPKQGQVNDAPVEEVEITPEENPVAEEVEAEEE